MKKLLTVLAALSLLALPAAAGASGYGAYQPAADRALAALENALDEQRASVYVYREFGDSQNHFTQKAKMWGVDESLVEDLDENWQENPAAGRTCIRCSQDHMCCHDCRILNAGVSLLSRIGKDIL